MYAKSMNIYIFYKTLVFIMEIVDEKMHIIKSWLRVCVQIPSMVISYHGNPHMDWNYKTEPEPNACYSNEGHHCNWIRGKVLGGCSVLNGKPLSDHI